jgi:hypothetical protein
MRTGRLLVAGLVALSGACTAHEANGGEQPALWPGISRWPGFPGWQICGDRVHGRKCAWLS